MTRSAALDARILYAGVALASGGISFYVPLLLSSVGLAHSGVWAAGIVCGTNLGRVAGSHFASRHARFTRSAGLIVANILLEGLALFSMAFLPAAWMLLVAATLAGLGSGLSFPGMKNALLRLDGLDPARSFAGLSVSFRVGNLVGYLAGAVVGGGHLVGVFSVLLLMFVAYAACMRVVLGGLDTAEATRPAPEPCDGPPRSAIEAPGDDVRVDVPLLLGANALFWFLTIQPTVAMSLYVPRYVPGLPVATSYWITTAAILLMQMPVTRRAHGARMHLAWLRVGGACLVVAFAVMALAGTHVPAVATAALLLGVSQVFFGPSLDTLVAGHARASGADTGRVLARQLFWQNLGMTTGSLAAGLLFDLGLRQEWPALVWIVAAAGALVLLALLASRTRVREGARAVAR